MPWLVGTVRPGYNEVWDHNYRLCFKQKLVIERFDGVMNLWNVLL